MASKRSGRSFREDNHHHHIPSDDTHRQGRHSRGEDPSIQEQNSSNTPSRHESRTPSVNHDMNTDPPQHKPTAGAHDAGDAKPSSSPTGGRGLKRGRQLPTLADVFSVLPAAPSGPYPRSSIPTEARPANFGVVLPGVYRSSYPHPENFAFMQELGLKTVITLGRPDEPDEVYYEFLAANSLCHHIIDMKGTKKENIPLHTMRRILSLVLDRRNYPLMVHCNHGKHRTGCVVAIIRKVYGWELSKILDEYESYAEPKVRECDVSYITNFKSYFVLDKELPNTEMTVADRALGRQSEGYRDTLKIVSTLS